MESLFCDIRSSPRYTLKTILITNLVFLVENLSPKVLYNQSLKVATSVLNHLSPFSDLKIKIPTLSQILAILKPDLIPSSFKLVSHVF